MDSRQHGFFIAKKERGMSGDLLSQVETQRGESHEQSQRPTTPGTPGVPLDFNWVIGSLADYENGFFQGVLPEDQYVCFTDPSTYPSSPGWMLRNLLVLIRRRWKLERVQILCYRDVQARRDDAKSIILSLDLKDTESVTSATQMLQPDLTGMPKVTGWERNAKGNVASRVANLGEYMDPKR